MEIWSYHTRTKDINSKVHLMFESFIDNQTIVFVEVTNVKIGADIYTIDFMPFEKSILVKSLIKKVGKQEVDTKKFEEKMEYWKKEKGGIYTIPLAEALDVLEETILS